MQIRPNWFRHYSHEALKEIPGYLSWFHWHCGVRMRRVICIEKTEQKGTRRVGCKGYICQVCDIRYKFNYD